MVICQPPGGCPYGCGYDPISFPLPAVWDHIRNLSTWRLNLFPAMIGQAAGALPVYLAYDYMI
jgi:hypothetical protein